MSNLNGRVVLDGITNFKITITRKHTQNLKETSPLYPTYGIRE